MERKWDSCSLTCSNLFAITSRSTKIELTGKDVKIAIKRSAFYRLPFAISILSPVYLKINSKSGNTRKSREADLNQAQDIEPGDIVRVRTEQEIRNTLDKRMKCKGLRFMPEMTKYCGQQMRVLKLVKKIMIESTGESREMRSRIYLLEGAYCDGEFHQQCDRSCLLFWRDDWFEKV
jgi:hypothetical protein